MWYFTEQNKQIQETKVKKERKKKEYTNQAQCVVQKAQQKAKVYKVINIYFHRPDQDQKILQDLRSWQSFACFLHKTWRFVSHFPSCLVHQCSYARCCNVAGHWHSLAVESMKNSQPFWLYQPNQGKTSHNGAKSILVYISLNFAHKGGGGGGHGYKYLNQTALF